MVDKTHIEKVVQFCNAIVSLTRKQRISVLKNMTRKQMVLIKEICLNILVNKEMNLTERDKIYFNNNLAKLRALGSHTSTLSVKKQIVENNQQLVKKLTNVTLKHLNKT